VAPTTTATRTRERAKATTRWRALFFCTTQLLTVSSSLPNPENAGTNVIDVVGEAWVLGVAGAAGIVGDFFTTRLRHRLLIQRDSWGDID
jgi:hypothetical protein